VLDIINVYIWLAFETGMQPMYKLFAFVTLIILLVLTPKLLSNQNDTFFVVSDGVGYPSNDEVQLYASDINMVISALDNFCISCIDWKINSNYLGIIIPALFMFIFGSIGYLLHLIVYLFFFTKYWSKLFNKLQIPLFPSAYVSSFFLVLGINSSALVTGSFFQAINHNYYFYRLVSPSWSLVFLLYFITLDRKKMSLSILWALSIMSVYLSFFCWTAIMVYLGIITLLRIRELRWYHVLLTVPHLFNVYTIFQRKGSLPNDILGVATASIGDIIVTIVMASLFFVLLYKKHNWLHLPVLSLLLLSLINFVYPWPQPWHYRFYLYIIFLCVAWTIPVTNFKRVSRYVSIAILPLLLVLTVSYSMGLQYPIANNIDMLVLEYNGAEYEILAKDLSVAQTIEANTASNNVFSNVFHTYDMAKLDCAVSLYVYHFNLDFVQINELMNSREYHLQNFHHRNYGYNFSQSVDCNIENLVIIY